MITISRYSLGTAMLPSTARLKRSINARRSCQSAACASVGRNFQLQTERCLPRPRRDRQPHRRVRGQRDRDDRAQPCHPEAAELARCMGSPPSRPLAHVFVQQGRQRAGAAFFATAVRLDPTFARAYAGLSFAHFQNAFQGWAQREPEIDRAYEAAAKSLMVDDRDPAAHWAITRSRSSTRKPAIRRRLSRRPITRAS